MLNLEKGRVEALIYEDGSIQILEVMLEKKERAINYINLTGKCKKGDKVVLNTIAERLKLGSGGYHFVYLNLNNEVQETPEGRSGGHILKMKYTPSQIRLKTIEEYEENRELINNIEDLGKKPVIVTTLHSMAAPISAAVKYKNENARIACIYTYGGSMNAEFSDSLKELKKKNIISSVITSGECFGGDFEAVNIFTALIYAYKNLQCDLAVITCGPGIAGTGNFYGFSTLEMIMPLYAAKALNLKPILSPRISFADKRERHIGISMQTMAILKTIDFNTIVPIYNSDKIGTLKDQFISAGINNNIIMETVGETCAREALDYFSLETRVMGRKYEEDRDYFDNCGAVGVYAADLLKNDNV